MLAPASVSDYRELARRRLPRVIFDYLDGGAFEEATLAANRADLQRLALKQKVLCDVSSVNTATTLFGQDLSLPLILAPVGFAGMMACRGETQAARAAEKAGIPFTLSTMGICPIEEVRQATAKQFWYQLYMMKDRGVARELLARAAAANCSALVFTVDFPVLGTRYRDIRNGAGVQLSTLAKLKFAWNFATHPSWIYDVGLKGRPLTFGNLSGIVKDANSLGELLAWTATALDPSVTWKDLEWIRSSWKGPLILKGILDVDDARKAVEMSADGIVVSNHGGRQLDAAVSTISMLPQIAEAVGYKTTVLMDGGIRSGQDLTRALALGAKACLIGRAWAYGLGARGETGVTAVLETMRRELRTSMALIGKTNVADIDASVLENSSYQMQP
jgi:L-lactate dehydrogenase (cytochrome)